MAEFPTTWQRIYRDHGPGLECAATEASTAAVLRSMNEAVGSGAPFKVRFRFADGRAVTVGPKKVRR